ncbi:MAG TPA: hypothetical protein VIE43_07130 [Thermoanaerobaculia bacterium]|nr:hypothetical protein [Thermoanaerobaculia bacterium]
MKRETLVPVLLVLALCAAANQARAEEPVKAALDAPFALSVGETARMEPEGLEVTLRSMSDDSGCDDPKECESILFKGTIFTRLGDKNDMAQITAFFSPDSPFTLDFAGYTIELTDIRRPKPKEPLYATFKVVKAAAPEAEKTGGDGLER